MIMSLSPTFKTPIPAFTNNFFTLKCWLSISSIKFAFKHKKFYPLLLQ